MRVWAQVMTIELKPDNALACLPRDRRFDRENRREAVRRMIEFGERRRLSLGEPVARQFLHEGHRI